MQTNLEICGSPEKVPNPLKQNFHDITTFLSVFNVYKSMEISSESYIKIRSQNVTYAL